MPHPLAARDEIHGRPHAHGRLEVRGILSSVSEALGKLIAPEAHADRQKRRERVSAAHRPHRPFAVRGVSRKVRPGEPVGQASAASEMRNHAPPAPIPAGRHERKRVVRLARPLQPVKVHHGGRKGIGSHGFHPVKRHEVPVRHVDEFAPILHPGLCRELCRYHRLQVRVRRPARGNVVGSEDRHQDFLRKAITGRRL